MLESSWTYTKKGEAEVRVLVKGKEVACDSCSLVYNPG
jgi:hypothetical protein